MLGSEGAAGNLTLGPADDVYESEADTVADQVVAALASAQTARAPQARHGGAAGDRLPEGTRGLMEARFGADFSRVRLHTGSHASRLNRAIESDALTHGQDIYLHDSSFNPKTQQGLHLLAHELTHVVQQGGAGAMPGSAGVAVRNVMPGNRISAKRHKKHLDFIRMKRSDTQIVKMLLHKIGVAKKPDDAYGHWWTEIGDLIGENWNPVESYGWWPSQKGMTIGKTLQGVPGVLNSEAHDGKATEDPHHGDPGQTEFHPVMEVDDNADYESVRTDVINRVRSFAKGFKGSWNWRLGWGKNCHTFQQRLKKAVGLHYQKGAGWLRRPTTASLHADDALEYKFQEEDEARERARPKNELRQPLDYYDGDDNLMGQLRPGELVSLSGGRFEDQLEVMVDGNFFWVRREELRTALQRPQATTTAPPQETTES